jgi:hypothetical protein
MPRKAVNQSKQEAFRATILVRAAEHYDLSTDILGVPHAGADKSTCTGHGPNVFCPACKFGYCGFGLCENSASGETPTFWNGRCAQHAGARVLLDESALRVLQIAKEKLGVEPGAFRVKRVAERRSSEPSAADGASAAAVVAGNDQQPKQVKKPNNAPAPLASAAAAVVAAKVQQPKAAKEQQPKAAKEQQPKAAKKQKTTSNNAPAPQAPVQLSISMTGEGSGQMRVVGQSADVVNHADGRITVTLTAHLARR